MNASSYPALLRLRKGEVSRLSGGIGRGVAVFEGQVWLTIDGDPRDIFVAAGESHDFDRDGDVVVQAFAPSALLPYGGPRHQRLAAEHRRIDAYQLTREARQARGAAMARLGARALRALGAGVARAGVALRRVLKRRTAPRPGIVAQAASHWKAFDHGAAA